MAKASGHWAIVGGGLLGMTLAYRLALQGKHVTLFEAADHLGGLASAWTLGNVVWDRHYHVTLLSDAHLRSLLAEIGLESEIEWVQTRTGFYTAGKLYSMSNTLEFLRFPPLNLLSKLRLGGTIFYASRISKWKDLEKIPVGDWLRRYSGRQTYEKIWLPLLRAKLGENHKKASAAFIWAIIARMYAARRTGLKKEMFGYVPGGYAKVLERFATVLTDKGVCIRLSCPVRKVGIEKRGGRIGIHLENGELLSFDKVVLTAAAPIASRMCPDLLEKERSSLDEIEYQGIICASLLLKKPLAEYYVTNITDSWVPFTAVIEMSALADRKYFGGNSLIYLPKYLPPDDSAFSMPDEHFREQFLQALSRMYPHFDRNDVLAFRISRVRYVLAISTLNYSARVPPMETSIPGLHIVNSAHIVNGTLNVNETVQLANSAAMRFLSGDRMIPTSN